MLAACRLLLMSSWDVRPAVHLHLSSMIALARWSAKLKQIVPKTMADRQLWHCVPPCDGCMSPCASGLAFHCQLRCAS